FAPGPQFGPAGQQVAAYGQPPVPPFGDPPSPAGGNRRRNWLVGGAVIAVLAVIAVVALVWLTGRPGAEAGASSADSAALDMLAAVTKKDTTAVVELIAPAEAGSMRQILDNAQAKAESVGVQKGGGHDGLLAGVMITTENVRTSVEDLRGNLARVTFTGGTLTAHFDPASANQGLKDLVGNDLESGQGTIDVNEMRVSGYDGESKDPFVMVVKQNDRWYVSPAYTAIEYSMLDAGRNYADYNASVVDPRGFETPEAAAGGFVSALSESVDKNNLDPVIAVLPAYFGELAATYRTFLTDEVDLNEVDQLTFADGKFSSEERSGVTFVNVDNLAFTAVADGERVQGVISGGCLRIDGESEQHCGDQVVRGQLGMSSVAGNLASKSAVVATQDVLGWHIDPVQSVLGGIRYSLDNVTEDQLYRLIGFNGGVAEMAMQAKADASMEGKNSVTLTLPDGPRNSASMGVVDVEVQAGQPVTIGLTGGRSSGHETFRVHTSDGIARTSDGSRWGSASSPLTFTPQTTETVKIEVQGDPNTSVEVTRR
ncbi:MAG: hypothetical protein WAW85_04870, partial [Gordonia sp. (in: high G+C Gram-positive bacteria)]